MTCKTIIILILGLLITQSCSVNHADTPKRYKQEMSTIMVEELEFAISSTPYSALIQYTGVNIIPILDSYPANELTEEKHIYHARVLGTYRGKQFDNISFSLVSEKGDGLINDKKLVVITLCVDSKGFFWPGTGSEFPATEEIIKAAQRISQDIKSVKQSFPYCE